MSCFKQAKRQYYDVILHLLRQSIIEAFATPCRTESTRTQYMHLAIIIHNTITINHLAVITPLFIFIFLAGRRAGGGDVYHRYEEKNVHSSPYYLTIGTIQVILNESNDFCLLI